MKIRSLFIMAFFGMQFLCLKAQITLDHTYAAGLNAPNQSYFQLINLGNNEYKYFYTDYSTNQIKLFNLNHTTYSTITVPVNLQNTSEYQVSYITRTLFDCDTTKFEYAILPMNQYRNFYVYREDGVLLFKKDSVLAEGCVGCGYGSFDLRPIANSPVGTKLFLWTSDTQGNLINVDIYSLCGTLSQSVTNLDAASTSYVKVFPNPSSGLTQFQFDLPMKTENAELVIYNSTGQVIKNIKISANEKSYSLDETSLSSGLYFYTVTDGSKIIQNGKFIITNK